MHFKNCTSNVSRCAPSYLEVRAYYNSVSEFVLWYQSVFPCPKYLSKAFFHDLPTVLCKIVGVYQIGYHNSVTGKGTMEQVAVIQNIFFGRKIARIFDLKGSLRRWLTCPGILDKENDSLKSKHGRRVKPRSPQRSRSEWFIWWFRILFIGWPMWIQCIRFNQWWLKWQMCEESTVRNQHSSAQKVSADIEKPEKKYQSQHCLKGIFLNL